jgi:hypothetical protein
MARITTICVIRTAAAAGLVPLLLCVQIGQLVFFDADQRGKRGSKARSDVHPR